MPVQLSDDYLRAYAAAVVREIKAQMGRQGVASNRELARLTGFTHTSVNDRLNANPRTGKPVIINVRDLAAFAAALDVEPAELLERAKAAVQIDELGARRRRAPAPVKKAARKDPKT